MVTDACGLARTDRHGVTSESVAQAPDQAGCGWVGWCRMESDGVRLPVGAPRAEHRSGRQPAVGVSSATARSRISRLEMTRRRRRTPTSPRAHDGDRGYSPVTTGS